MTRHDIVRTFWHGAPLSEYERTSIRSYVRQGHAVEVYGYEPLVVPDGATFVDARSILPESDVFAYATGPGAGSFSAFSNLFRYKVLHALGGIWSDLDVFCLRPFSDLPESCVGRQDVDTVATGIMRFPPGHPLMGELYDRASAMGRSVVWGQIGPRLMTASLPAYPAVVILPEATFYPVPWRSTAKLLCPAEHDACEAASATSHALHWWNEIVRRIGTPKDRLPPTGSWLERRAASLTDDVLPTWSASMMQTWLDNHRMTEIAGPLLKFRDSSDEVPDLLRDLGEASLRDGAARKAVELLSAAHTLRPSGHGIWRLLVEARAAVEREAL